METAKNFGLGLSIMAGMFGAAYFSWWAWPYSGYALGALVFAVMCHSIGDDIRHPGPPRMQPTRKR